MAETKEPSKAYIYDGKTYLGISYSQRDINTRFIANGDIEGIKQQSDYPDYVVFPCIAKEIIALIKQKDVLGLLQLKDEFKGVSKFPETVSGTPDELKEVLSNQSAYYTAVYVPIPDKVETIDFITINWDNPPVMPQYAKVIIPFAWAIDNPLYYSKYPCVSSNRDIYPLLLTRAEELYNEHPEWYSEHRVNLKISYGRDEYFAVRKKDYNGNRSDLFELSKWDIERDLPHGIRGNNLIDLQKNIQAYIDRKLQYLIQEPLMKTGLPAEVSPNKIDFFYTNGQTIRNYVCITMYPHEFRLFVKVIGYVEYPVVRRFLSRTKIGADIVAVFDYINSKMNK